MGSFFSHIQRPIGVAAESVTDIIRGRKRKRSDDEEFSCDEMSTALEQTMNTPKRKKLTTTAQYIYQALYKEEKNTDVCVFALGKKWHLHKIYLSQSPYFASMFGGSWRESTQNFIKIEIIDPRITIDSLSIVFGSFYLDEVELDPQKVVSILATASLFQLEGLLDKAAEVMTETLNAETAVSYFEAACQYGIHSVKESSFKWLLVNLMSLFAKNYKWLRTINVDLMYALVSSPELYVIPTEFSLYVVLKYWMFFKLHPEYEFGTSASSSSQSESSTTSNPSTSTSSTTTTATSSTNDTNQLVPAKDDPLSYFIKRDGNTAFLETFEGRKFQKVFRALRIEHLITDLDLMVLFEDKIIPRKWLHLPIIHQWSTMLRIDLSVDKGPNECDEATFYKNCLRCGRLLQEEGFQKWRWNGFNFGLSLVLITDTRMLSIKRYHRSEDERMLSLQLKRSFLIRVTIASLNELRQIKHSQTTGIKSLTLEKNEEIHLMVMEKELVYPLLISVNLLVVTPHNDIETIDSKISIVESANDVFNLNNAGQSDPVNESCRTNQGNVASTSGNRSGRNSTVNINNNISAIARNA